MGEASRSAPICQPKCGRRGPEMSASRSLIASLSFFSRATRTSSAAGAAARDKVPARGARASRQVDKRSGFSSCSSSSRASVLASGGGGRCDPVVRTQTSSTLDAVRHHDQGGSSEGPGPHASEVVTCPPDVKRGQATIAWPPSTHSTPRLSATACSTVAFFGYRQYPGL